MYVQLDQYLFVIISHATIVSLLLQLAQTELEGLDPNCRRFRLENGESLAEKDEVSMAVTPTSTYVRPT